MIPEERLDACASIASAGSTASTLLKPGIEAVRRGMVGPSNMTCRTGGCVLKTPPVCLILLQFARFVMFRTPSGASEECQKMLSHPELPPAGFLELYQGILLKQILETSGSTFVPFANVCWEDELAFPQSHAESPKPPNPPPTKKKNESPASSTTYSK